MKEQEHKGDEFKPGIFIDKRGRWYQDGIAITHRWTYLHNNKLLSRDEEGRYYIEEGRGRIYVEVEDTPFVVKMVDKRSDGFYIILNDETEERLNLDVLWMNRENIPYTKVKNGEFEARFLRPAYYEFTKHLKQEGDEFYIRLGEVKYLKIQRIE
jgi:Uncharacterized protein conserved in bacteria